MKHNLYSMRRNFGTPSFGFWTKTVKLEGEQLISALEGAQAGTVEYTEEPEEGWDARIEAERAKQAEQAEQAAEDPSDNGESSQMNIAAMMQAAKDAYSRSKKKEKQQLIAVAAGLGGLGFFVIWLGRK